MTYTPISHQAEQDVIEYREHWQVSALPLAIPFVLVGIIVIAVWIFAVVTVI